MSSRRANLNVLGFMDYARQDTASSGRPSCGHFESSGPMNRPAAREQLVLDLNLLASGLTQRTKIGVERAVMADYEARHEAEERVIDFSVFGNAHDRAGAAGLNQIGPGPRVGQILRGDAALDRIWRGTVQHLVGHCLAIAGGFARQTSGRGVLNHFPTVDIP